MKKVVLFLMAAIFAVGMMTSCEDLFEDPTDDPIEDPVELTLSEFILDYEYWVSDTVNVDDDVFAIFSTQFKDSTYIMTMVPVISDTARYDESIELPEAGYVVDNEKNYVTIEDPQFPGDEPSDELETTTFNVSWSDNDFSASTMTWSPLEGEDAPVITWTVAR